MAQTVKTLPVVQETRVPSLGREDPLEKVMATHSSILSGEPHGQRSQAGYSPWSHKESDITERLTLSLHFQSTHGLWLFSFKTMPANLENSAVATGLEKVSFSSQSHRKAMPKNAQTTA